MMQFHRFVFNPFMENTYVLFDETHECVIIDPGCYDKEEENELTDFIRSNNLVVKQLLNTHCHIDHVLGNAFVKNKFGVTLAIHPKEEFQLKAVKSYAPNYGFPKYHEADAEEFLKQGDKIFFGNQTLEIVFGVREGDHIRLEPATGEMSPIIVRPGQDIRILGTLAGVMRKC